MKPIIGIVAKYVEDTNDRQEALIRDEVKNAIIDNGGIAIGILPSETEVAFTKNASPDSWPEYLTQEQKQDCLSHSSRLKCKNKY